jgi:protein PhnA
MAAAGYDVTAQQQQDRKGFRVDVKDSNGNLLVEGDTVILTRDLKVKGANATLKRGTVIRNIHLTADEEEIEGRTDKVKGLVLKTCFVKKA